MARYVSIDRYVGVDIPNWAITTTLPRSLREADTMTGFVSISAPGGFGAPSDGGGKNLRKPGDEAPHKGYYAEASALGKSWW